MSFCVCFQYIGCCPINSTKFPILTFFLSLYNFFFSYQTIIDFIYTQNVNFKLQVIDYVMGDYTLVLVENSISIHLFFFNSWLLTEDLAVFIPFCSCRAFAIII